MESLTESNATIARLEAKIAEAVAYIADDFDITHPEFLDRSDRDLLAILTKEV